MLLKAFKHVCDSEFRSGGDHHRQGGQSALQAYLPSTRQRRVRGASLSWLLTGQVRHPAQEALNVL